MVNGHTPRGQTPPAGARDDAGGRTPAALARFRVLDLSTCVAGPYCTKLLADYGADVLKVEPPEGDPVRRSGPFPGDVPEPDASGLFLHLNTSKRAVTLNLETAEGRALLLEMLPRFDVLVESFAPGFLAAIGLDDAALAAANPRLVVTRITPFGQTGPYRDYQATDLVLQALSGMMSHTGEPAQPPLKLFGAQAYYVAGTHAAVATLAALRRRDATGALQQVDLAVMLCATNIIVPQLTSWAYNRATSGRRGHGRGAWGVYPCADGFVSISVYHHGREWGDFVEMLGIEALRDPKFATASGRIEHVEELETHILGWVIGQHKKDVAERGRKHRIAIGYDATVADLVASPQLEARGYFVPLDHPVAGRQLYPGAPVRMSGTPWRVQRPAPRLGEHNEAVYRDELGRRPEEIVRMRRLATI